MNRDALLIEMGLGPIWKLRVPPPMVATRSEPDESAATSEREATAVSMLPVGRVASSGIRVALQGPDGEREAAIARMDWDQLGQAVAGCTACTLCERRQNTVFGVGNRSARWFIVGEAPGAEEDARGEPFVGQAGQLLDAMLASLAMSREKDVYIANVLKCRPPGNRNPEVQEVAQCAPHLRRQIELAAPSLLLLMGRFAAQTLLATDASIASMRGRVHRIGEIPAIVTYHPAYLLRTPLDKAKAWQDLLFARATAASLQSGQSATT